MASDQLQVSVCSCACASVDCEGASTGGALWAASEGLGTSWSHYIVFMASAALAVLCLWLTRFMPATLEHPKEMVDRERARVAVRATGA